MNDKHRSPMAGNPEDWMSAAQYDAGKIHGCVIGFLISSAPLLIIGGLIYAIAHLPGW